MNKSDTASADEALGSRSSGVDGRTNALARGLKGRHVQLIAIGGTIGVGLFLGSGRAIATAGPALLVDYALGGMVIFLLLRALGELLLYRPVAGSFADYAEEFVGPFAGFVTGWSYWFMWIVTCMAESTAVGIYVHYWFPQIPQWATALSLLLSLYVVNLMAVQVFGEIEFWFALIKVSMIVALLVMGIVILTFAVGPLAPTARVANLWEHGGFFPFGVAGMGRALQIVMFAYSGVEMIGVTAGEVDNPERDLPRAINNVIYRILIFYIGSLFLLMSLMPWNILGQSVSPFVFVFEKLRIPGAANIVNFVVITAAASSCSSGIYCTSRMLYTLGQKGIAWRFLGVTNARLVPSRGIGFSTTVMLIGVVLNYVVPERAFAWLTSIVLVGTLWTWGIIMVSHLGYRRAVRLGLVQPVSFRMPGAPVTTWIVISGVLVTVVALWFGSETRIALFVAPFWFGILGLGYWRQQRMVRRGAASIALRG